MKFDPHDVSDVPNAYEVRVTCMAYGCEWTPDAMRRAYEAIVAAWTEAGFQPDRLGADAPGLTRNWGTFKYKRKRLERTKFEGVDSFSLSHLTAPTEHRALEDLYPDSDWLVYSSIITWYERLNLGWIPALIGEVWSRVVDDAVITRRSSRF